MGLSFLLDTNIVSEPLKKHRCPAVLERLAAHHDSIAISAGVWFELRYGAERLPSSRKRRTIEKYLAVLAHSLPVLPFDQASADWLAVERARLNRSGITPPLMDGQIAAVAAHNSLILVTRNVRDFAGFKGLSLEDWSTG